MQIKSERVKKSERLDGNWMLRLRNFIKAKGTLQDASDAIGISINTLVRVQALKSCSPITAEKIRNAVKNTSVAVKIS